MAEDLKKTILIVDDEDDFRTLLADRLRFEGYEVLEAANGSIGVDVARAHHPDLVLLDIMMPLLNGHQCWLFFQKDPELMKIPILILSAKMQATDIFFRGVLSEEDYIGKSLSFNSIIQKIQKKMTQVKLIERQSFQYL